MTNILLLLLFPAVLCGCFKYFKPKKPVVITHAPQASREVVDKASLAHRIEADAIAVAARVATHIIQVEAEKEEKKLLEGK